MLQNHASSPRTGEAIVDWRDRPHRCTLFAERSPSRLSPRRIVASTASSDRGQLREVVQHGDGRAPQARPSRFRLDACSRHRRCRLLPSPRIIVDGSATEQRVSRRKAWGSRRARRSMSAASTRTLDLPDRRSSRGRPWGLCCRGAQRRDLARGRPAGSSCARVGSTGGDRRKRGGRVWSMPRRL